MLYNIDQEVDVIAVDLIKNGRAVGVCMRKVFAEIIPGLIIREV